MATDLGPDPQHTDNDPRVVSWVAALDNSRLAAAAAVVGVVILFAAMTGMLVVAVGGLLLVVAVIAAFTRGHEPIVVLVAASLILRPLLDLTAGPRDDAVSPTEIFGLATIMMMSWWLVNNLHLVRERIISPLSLTLWAYFGITVFATLGSTEPLAGVASSLRLLAGVLMFLVIDILLHTGRLRPRNLIAIFAATAVIPLTYPVLTVVGVEVWQRKDQVEALKSVFYLSNNLAYFLMPLVVLGMAYALRSTGWQRLAALAVMGVAGFELLLTATRGAWVGTAIAVIIVSWFLDKRVAALAALVGVVMVIFVPSVNARVTSLSDDPYDPRGGSSLDWRFDQWAKLFPEVFRAPVLGNGPGESMRLTANDPHNDYLRAALETGLLGFAMFLGVLGAMLFVAWSAWRRMRRLTRPDDESVADWRLIYAILTGIAAHSVSVAIGALGENLFDLVTFTWNTLPLFALAEYLRRVDPQKVRL